MDKFKNCHFKKNSHNFFPSIMKNEMVSCYIQSRVFCGQDIVAGTIATVNLEPDQGKVLIPVGIKLLFLFETPSLVYTKLLENIMVGQNQGFLYTRLDFVVLLQYFLLMGCCVTTDVDCNWGFYKDFMGIVTNSRRLLWFMDSTF